MRTAPSAPPRSLLLRAHAALWTVAGLGAGLYLGWSFVGPGIDLAATSNGAIKGDRRPALESGGLDGQRFENALTRIAQDVRAVQDKLAAGEDQTHALLGRMASLEEKTAVLTTSGVSGGPPASPVSTSANRRESNPQAAAITTGAILQRVTSAPSSTETGIGPAAAVLAPQSAAAPPPAAAQPKAVHGVQLSSATNLDALRLNWSLLSEKHRQLLGALQTRYRQSPGKPNAPFQLIAGPVRSTGDAARICKELSASGIACRATTFSGEVL
jgi:hypothetical protein